MSEAMKRGAKEGVGFGLIAGAIFVVMEVVGAAMMGQPALMPIRMFASTVLGQAALMESSAAAVLIVGTIVHFALSGVFGLIYGLINGRFSTSTETSFGRQAGLGLLFGAMLWLANFQLIARVLYPWFLDAPQFLQMAMHAMFFGLPLGLMYAAAERRAHHSVRHVGVGT
ncbi:MAG: hypothetical protein Q8N23_24285 [Archangium sp.]|nr:hypothetical protein [Archangium sp.]MDP3155814.1 hypothetical protein [Archangium sp.]MDP3574188.1 hypothetical protein [Archangium sp.]